MSLYKNAVQTVQPKQGMVSVTSTPAHMTSVLVTISAYTAQNLETQQVAEFCHYQNKAKVKKGNTQFIICFRFYKDARSFSLKPSL